MRERKHTVRKMDFLSIALLSEVNKLVSLCLRCRSVRWGSLINVKSIKWGRWCYSINVNNKDRAKDKVLINVKSRKR